MKSPAAEHDIRIESRSKLADEQITMTNPTLSRGSRQGHGSSQPPPIIRTRNTSDQIGRSSCLAIIAQQILSKSQPASQAGQSLGGHLQHNFPLSEVRLWPRGFPTRICIDFPAPSDPDLLPDLPPYPLLKTQSVMPPLSRSHCMSIFRTSIARPSRQAWHGRGRT